MTIRTPSQVLQDERADEATASRGALDYGGIDRALTGGVREIGAVAQARSSAIQQTRETVQAPKTKSATKVMFNPTTKQYFVGGKVVPARYDTLKYLSQAKDLPDITERPKGFVPVDIAVLGNYVTYIEDNMESSPLDMAYAAMKTGVGDAVVGLPKLLGYDFDNPYEDENQKLYEGASLYEQAGMDQGAFDSTTGFVNAVGSGVGSAAPSIAAGLTAGALTLNPLVGLGVAAVVGGSQSASAASTQSKAAILESFGELDEDERRESSPSYAALRDHGISEEVAVEQVAFEASRWAGGAAALTTLPETLIGGKLVGNFLKRVPILKGLSDKLVKEAVEMGDSKLASALGGAINKVPKPLRFLGRTGAVGTAEGIQEVGENVAGMVAGNTAAGVGSTNASDFVKKEDFEGGFAAGVFFGAIGGKGGNRDIKNSDIGAAFENTETPDAVQSLAPPPKIPLISGTATPTPMPPGGPTQDQSLEQQQMLVGNVLAERYGPDWADRIEELAETPGAGPLIGQLMGIEREIEQRDAAAQQEVQGRIGSRMPAAPVDPGIPDMRNSSFDRGELSVQMANAMQNDDAGAIAGLVQSIPPEMQDQVVQRTAQILGITPEMVIETMNGLAEKYAQTQGAPAGPVMQPGAAPAAVAPGAMPDGRLPGETPVMANPEPMAPAEAAARQEAQAARGPTDVDMNAGSPAVVAPIEAPVDVDAMTEDGVLPSTPEPAADIDAQIEAMLDPESSRDAVFVEESQAPAELPPSLKGRGVKIAIRPGVGVLLTTNASKAKQFELKKDLNDKDIARLIGISASKADAVKATSKAKVVQAKTPAGAVQAEAIAAPKDLKRAVKDVKKQATPAAKIEVTTAEKAQERRAKEPTKLGTAGQRAKAKSLEKSKGKPAAKTELKPVAVAEAKATSKAKEVKKKDPAPARAALTAEQVKNPTDVKALGVGVTRLDVPDKLVREVGAEGSVINLRVQTPDTELRAQLQARLAAGTVDKRDAQRVIDAIDRLEAVLDAEIKSDIDAYLKSTDPSADPSSIYTDNLSDGEVVMVLERLRDQAAADVAAIQEKPLSPNDSAAFVMLKALAQSQETLNAWNNISQLKLKQLLQSVSEWTGPEIESLATRAGGFISRVTMAKQAVRGASAVARYAGRRGAQNMESLQKVIKSYVTGYGVPDAATNLVDGWAKIFERKAGVKMANDLRVMSIADAIAMFPDRSDIRPGVTAAYIRQYIDNKPVHIFAVNWNAVPEPVAVEALAHEFGHFVSSYMMERADTKTRQALKYGHAKWLEANAGKTASEIMLSRMTPLVSQHFDAEADRSMEYATSFHEWAADNVAKWLLTKQEPASLVDKFFARVAAVMREVYEGAIGKGKPDAVWQMVLDNWTAGARARNVQPEPENTFAEGVQELDAGLLETARQKYAANIASKRAAKNTKKLGVLQNIFKEMMSPTGRENVFKKYSASKLGGLIRKYGLQLLTMHQIADKYQDTPIGVPLRTLVNVRDRIDADARNLQKLGADALDRAQNLSAEVQGILNDVMGMATRYEMHPDKDMDHADNAHIFESSDAQVQQEQGRRYYDVRAAYEEMIGRDPRAEKIYSDLRDAFEAMSRETALQRKENRLLRVKDPEAIKKIEEEFEKLSKQKRRGPYFPLVRNGEWIVTALMPADAFGDGGLVEQGADFFKSKSAAAKEANNLRQLYPGAQVVTEPTEDGEYLIRVYRRHVAFYDSEAAALAAEADTIEEVKAEYRARGRDYDATMEALKGLDENKDGVIVGKPFKKLTSYESDKAPPTESFMRELKAQMQDAGASEQLRAAVEEMYLESLPEFSFRKSMLQRENIMGASKEMLAAYATRYAGAAHNLATIKESVALNKSWETLKALRTTFSEAGDVVNTIELNDKLVRERTSNTPGNRALNYISDLNSFFSLALAPAYVLTNLMQPAMISIPYMAGLSDRNGKGIGIVKASDYMKEAYSGTAGYFSKRGMQDFVTEFRRLAGKESGDTGLNDHVNDLINKFGKTAQERQLLQELMDRGRLDFSFLNSIQDAMHDGELGRRFSALTRLGMAFPQQVEAMNRVVSALAMYRMVMKEQGLDHNSAVMQTDAMVRKTQLDYSRKNRPVLFNRPLMGLVLQFRLYAQGMYMLFIENAARIVYNRNPGDRAQGFRTIGYLMGTHAAIGGLTGITPLVYPAKMALFALSKALGDDEEDLKWKTADDMLNDMASDLFGADGGRAVMNGLPTLFNVDVSDRLGLPQLIDTRYTGITERDTPANQFDKTFLYLMGSPYSNARRVFGAVAGTAGALQDGDPSKAYKAAAAGLPAGMRAGVRAMNAGAEGIVDKDGDVFVSVDQLDWGDLAIMGAGLQTADVAQAYRDRGARYGVKGKISLARAALLQRWRTTAPEKRQDLQDEIREFNRTVPVEFQISGSQLQKSIDSKGQRDAGVKNKQDSAIDKMF